MRFRLAVKSLMITRLLLLSSIFTFTLVIASSDMQQILITQELSIVSLSSHFNLQSKYMLGDLAQEEEDNVMIMVYFNMGSQNKPGEILIFTGFIVLYISRLGFCYDLACNLVVKPHLNSVTIFLKTLACEAHTLPPTA